MVVISFIALDPGLVVKSEDCEVLGSNPTKGSTFCFNRLLDGCSWITSSVSHNYYTQ